MIERFKGAQEPIAVCVELERGYLNIVQLVLEIWSQGKKSTRPQVLLAPGRVLKLLSASGSGAATLKWGRSPHGDVRTDLKTVLFKDGNDLIVVSNGTLKF